MVQIRYNDLPDNLGADKVDPISRYVNDEDLLHIGDDIKLLQLQYNDLPDNLGCDKIDPVSRYVNDEDLHGIR